MSTFIMPDAQATTTHTILNIVRYLGVAGWALFAVIALIASTQNSYAALFVPVSILGAAFWYASLGWFVDTLRLLTKIEANTRA